MLDIQQQIASDASRDTFIRLFPNISDAMAFESTALSIGRDFLPECAENLARMYGAPLP